MDRLLQVWILIEFVEGADTIGNLTCMKLNVILSKCPVRSMTRLEAALRLPNIYPPLRWSDMSKISSNMLLSQTLSRSLVDSAQKGFKKYNLILFIIQLPMFSESLKNSHMYQVARQTDQLAIGPFCRMVRTCLCDVRAKNHYNFFNSEPLLL